MLVFQNYITFVYHIIQRNTFIMKQIAVFIVLCATIFSFACTPKVQSAATKTDAPAPSAMDGAMYAEGKKNI